MVCHFFTKLLRSKFGFDLLLVVLGKTVCAGVLESPLKDIQPTALNSFISFLGIAIGVSERAFQSIEG